MQRKREEYNIEDDKKTVDMILQQLGIEKEVSLVGIRRIMKRKKRTPLGGGKLLTSTYQKI